ncbi:dystroglycan-like [Dorcoceras hygrometricum]|uniref:Dystroglycan-like n=1 Tax=Dorcoceras hygrometricum TaxID=472368 RepID=A0A2Z7D508_9LAMI|nr:dystroglycan-like [Dorcoceras hygrometricum]
MAALFNQNALQISFDSVLSLSADGMVSMFKALESSGLRGFLGCSTAIYEKDMVNLFENAIVRGDTVISSVQGVFVEISEEQFAGVFDLPTEGLTSVNVLPANRINEARRVFSEVESRSKLLARRRR